MRRDVHQTETVVASDLAMRATLRRGGLTAAQVEELDRPDLILLARTMARANYVAQTDRKLLTEQTNLPPATKYEPRSYRVAVILFALTVLALIFACGFFGRIIL